MFKEKGNSAGESLGTRVNDDKIPKLNTTLYEWLMPRTKGLEDFKAQFHSEEEMRIALEIQKPMPLD